MTTWTLIRRSLRFHARAHFGVLLGAAVGSAVLIGALVVGDSVKESLRKRALDRLGPIHFAISTQDRLFLADLRQRLSSDKSPGFVPVDTVTPERTLPFSSSQSASALVLNGMVAQQDGQARANRVQVMGVESATWPRLAGWGTLSEGFWITNGSSRFHFDEVDRMQGHRGDGPLTRWRNGETALINEVLAGQLGAQIGDELIVRVSKPTALGLDAAISPRDENSVALRFKVGAILSADQLGDFSLSANQTPPANLLVPMELLTEKVGARGRANLLVSGPVLTKPKFSRWDVQRSKVASWLRKQSMQPEGYLPFGRGVRLTEDKSSLASRLGRSLKPKLQEELSDELARSWVNTELRRSWLPEDTELVVRGLEQPQTATGGEYVQPFIEVSTARIFLDPPVAAAALTPRSRLLRDHQKFLNDTPSDLAASAWVTNGFGVLTYFVNLIQAGDLSTPYSMVTAAGPPYTPADLGGDEILVNEWLADDLQVKPGDNLRISYYVVDSGSRLTERTNIFRVRGVVPMRGRYADRTLMPEFPGVAKAERTREWDTGFPLMHEIRQKDEDYWKQHRGTPKAFISLAAGQAMWANRYGQLTAIRYEVPTNSFTTPWREIAYQNLLANLDPATLGISFEPVRAQALKAAEQAQDFGQLFLGFSFFLIMAALLLMALLFQFGLEQRMAEVGTLLALGFPPRQVRRLLLLEGCALAFVGGMIGVLAGTVYAKAMLRGLTTIWRDAVSTSALHYHVQPITLVIGLLASTLIAALTIWLTLRKQGRRPARELLEVGSEEKFQVGRSRASVIGAVATAGAASLVIWTIWKGETGAAEIFFSAGALLLIAGLGFCAAWFARLARRTAATSQLTIGGLGLRGCSRRRKRSLATVALLASGTFLIAAIGVFRLDSNRDATKRSSGTGGFALVGDSTLPVVHDLNSKSGREFFGFDSEKLAGVEFVPFRVRDGDDASCLNLNRAQKPRLLGVKTEMLEERFTFAKGTGWDALISTRLQPGGRGTPESKNRLSGFTNSNQTANTGLKPGANEIEIPAIGDANSIQWAMGRKVGGTIDYVDERGQPFKVRIVGAVVNSILQGSLIIDEAAFIKRFPSESGYRMFLIDSPTNRTAEVSATLSRALQDVGLELQPTEQRLAAFNAVQNTYLNTFQILGGLGLLLGSAGLGVVVLRNVLERRGELALLLAVGFRARSLRWLVLSEHGALLWLGLGVGVIAAIVAVLPSLLSPGAEVPYLSLAITLTAVLINGMIWTWLATRFALRGKLLDALRNE